jgi:endonuclease/exonuclease/phosphatase (EEP) superfamily protein YafD
MLRKILLGLAIILSVVGVAATLISTTEHEQWFFRLCDFPRVQVAFFLLFAIIIFCIYRWRKKIYTALTVLILFACFCWQCFKIYPYTTLGPYQVLPSTASALDTLSIVYSNVYMENRDSESALYEMNKYDPDIILAVETDLWWAEKLRALAPEYPYHAEMPRNNTYGMILYSKLPIEHSQFRFLVDPEIPSLDPVVTLRSGQKVKCYFVHPKPPAPQEEPSSKPRDKELIMVAKEAKVMKLPVIVAGDLNDVGWSFTNRLFQENSGLLDPRKGRGMYSTFNAKYPVLRWPLDHVFISRDWRVVKLERLDYIGSDHFPIYFELSFEPDKKSLHEQLVPEQEDLEKAEEKLNQDLK